MLISILAILRARLGLQSGDKVSFFEHTHGVMLTKQKNDITSSFGILSVNKRVSLNDIEQAINQGPFDIKPGK